LELRGLELEDTITYAVKTLSVEADEFVELFKLLKGHPYYLARVMDKLKSGKDIASALEEIVEEERAYIELLVERILGMKHALEVLRTMAKGGNPYQVEGIKDQVISRVLSNLVNFGYIRKVSRGVYEFIDPLLKLYLRGDY
jgi:hypothetical protein